MTRHKEMGIDGADWLIWPLDRFARIDGQTVVVLDELLSLVANYQ